MYQVIRTNQFKRDWKKYKFDARVRGEFQKVIKLLATKESLPIKYNDHQLTGNLSSFRECHIFGDVLLIYRIYQDKLILSLTRIGSHGKLFGKQRK